MAENLEPPREIMGRDEGEAAVRSLIDELKGSERLQALGLEGHAVEVSRSVLCSLWRNTPLEQLDILRGMLPGGIDLMFASCERPHGKLKPPDTFRRDLFLDDVSEHLGIPYDAALTVSGVVLHALRERMSDEEVEEARTLVSADLMDFLLRPV